MRRRLSGGLVIAAVLCAAPVFAREPARGQKGMVATGSEHATDAAVDMLRGGGNAVDAAVTAAFVLAVTLPQGGNLGGGGFALVRDVDGTVTALDFREKAPELAHPFIFLDDQGEVIPERSTVGIFAAGVPGSVAGLQSLHERFGERPWPEVLAPAVELARQGFAVGRKLAQDLESNRDKLSRFPETTAVFFREGRPLREGEILRQEDLARTLERLQREGAADFYRGETARLVARTSSRHQGLLTERDLELYRPQYREPLASRWRDLTLYSMPLPSSGGVTLIEILNLIEPYDLKSMGPRGALYLSVLAEAGRLAFYDRAQHLGDPDYHEAPVERLVSKAYADRLRTSMVPGTAGPNSSLRWDLAESSDTTHLSVADSSGRLVALTTTINGLFGSGLVVEGAGFLLNNEMDDFAARPGAPNMYGLTGGLENSVEPGKRMLSSMAPTIVTRGDEPYLVLGSRGGPRIITTVLQVLLNVAVHGMNVQDAVDFPRIHHQGSPDLLFHEPFALSADTAAALCEGGYALKERETMSGCQAIAVTDEGFEGAADPRYAGSAAGF